ncbi:hypothetical protein B7Y92_01810 [Candidatus Saccharibacteria bacterium 32-50-13]|nr:MAG: hypothetical protein B7Y92_01810 [Candidatus Saccharibacteria bacterium 32-50-13]
MEEGDMSSSESLYQSKGWMGYGPASRPTQYEILLRQSRLMGRSAAKACKISPNVIDTFRHDLIDGDTAERKFFERNPDHIHKIVEQSQEILAGAKTVILPYNLFPDTVTIDRMKVTITLWQSLWSREVVTLRIEDILNVQAHIGLLFGSLTISTRVMNSTDHFQISGFWNRDAKRLKHIIQGYMIALHQGIDVSGLTTERLTRKLLELGDDPRVVK